MEAKLNYSFEILANSEKSKIINNPFDTERT